MKIVHLLSMCWCKFKLLFNKVKQNLFHNNISHYQNETDEIRPVESLLYSKSYRINDKINIVIPTVGDVLKTETAYYSLVAMLTSMPVDMMAQLDDMGIDFTEINDYELFLILFQGIKTQDTSLIFGDLDLTKFELAVNEENNMPVLLDRENDIVIDRGIYMLISDSLRRIHHLEKNLKHPANKEAKDYMIKKARKKLKSKKKDANNLESLIVSMVNTPEFKYDFNTVESLTIYQFNESVRQVIKKVEFNNRMYGVYAGTVDTKKLSQDELNWLVHK